jgi:hypothetical protein
LVTLAPNPPAAFVDAAVTPSAPRAARARHDQGAPRAAWWQWLDFDSEHLAQVWVICCAQILILVIAGLVIHASAASPY